MRRPFAVLVAVALVLVLLAAGSPAAVAAEAPVRTTGWWSRQPLAQPVADGGFAVMWAVEQEQAAAAVRIPRTSELQGTVYLTLHERGGAAQDQGGILACRTTAPWTSVNPGPYEALPPSTCAAGSSVELGRDGSAGVWVADITALLAAASGPALDLVLHPVGRRPAAELPVTAPFEVQFARATLLIDAGTPPPGLEPPPAAEPGGVDPGLPGGGAPPSALDLPLFPPEVPPAATVPTTEPPSPGDLVALGPVDGTGSDDAPWGRLAVLLPISALSGLGLAAVRRRTSAT